jgi:hypothetical protein
MTARRHGTLTEYDNGVRDRYENIFLTTNLDLCRKFCTLYVNRTYENMKIYQNKDILQPHGLPVGYSYIIENVFTTLDIKKVP